MDLEELKKLVNESQGHRTYDLSEETVTEICYNAMNDRIKKLEDDKALLVKHYSKEKAKMLLEIGNLKRITHAQDDLNLRREKEGIWVK